MCGRYTLTVDPAALQAHFGLENAPEWEPRYNIAPTQPVPVITNANPKAVTFHRWGLIPSWSKDPSIASRLINARAETLDEKPSFRTAFKRRRCLIPATGFFEWAKDGRAKKPMYFYLKDGGVYAFAGLWELWRNPEGEEIATCTIITTEPNEIVKPLHHRMAVILEPEDYDLWLSPDELGPEVLKPLLRAYPAENMAVHEVSKLVNSPANDSLECIKSM